MHASMNAAKLHPHKPRVEHRSQDHDWRTPPEILDLVRALGPIAVDLATSDDNPTGAADWISPSHVCAIGSRPRARGASAGIVPEPWHSASEWRPRGVTWCNPPYGRALPAWAAMLATYGRPRDRDCYQLALVPSRTDARWFRLLWGSAQSVCLLSRRVRFLRPDGTRGDSAAFPSAIFCWGDAPSFARVFGAHGIFVICGG